MTTRHMEKKISGRRPAPAGPWRHVVLTLSSSTVVVLTGLLMPLTGTAVMTPTISNGLSVTPGPSFTPHVVATTGTGFAPGRLRVALHVKPGCTVVLPHSGELAKVRMNCSDGAVWLGNLVPQRAFEPMANRRSVAFVPLRFERQADGFRPYPEGQGTADAPMLAPQSGVRFDLDY